jgi:type I restriction enzyme S subunit
VNDALPSGWTSVAASELFSFITSGSRGWAAHYVDDGAKFIRVQNVRRGRIDLDLEGIQHVRPPVGARVDFHWELTRVFH